MSESVANLETAGLYLLKSVSQSGKTDCSKKTLKN